jgi:1-deoxy-D-xylulose-5-phosphate reductoisomerase
MRGEGHDTPAGKIGLQRRLAGGVLAEERVARRVGAEGRTYPAVYNGANEACVAGFLKGRVAFPDIVETVARVVDDHVPPAGRLTVEDVLAADSWARERARELLPVMAGGGAAAGGEGTH